MMNKAEKMSNAEKKFVLKAAECIYNRIWKCKHPKQRGIKCDKICDYYQNAEI